jgi:putative DNA primase/helicase
MLGARAGLLGLADIERSRFALSQLPGKTLVVATEQPALYMTCSHVLNAIISGEPITVERKYLNAVTITPHAKLVWAMNELPRVGNAGDGLFRRVKVVKFPPLATAPDPEVKRVIATEGAGILNWALTGLERLRARGRFEIPPCVEDATTQFQNTNDVPAAFVAEKCITGPDYKTQSAELYTAYRDWAIATGHKPQSSTTLAAEWARLGFKRGRSDGRAFWHGIELAEATINIDDLIK